MDETNIKVKGACVYLYRGVDKLGKTLDFMLSERRNKPAATRFFARMLEVNGLPRKIAIYKSGANTAGLEAINKMLKSFGYPIQIEMVRRKHLTDVFDRRASVIIHGPGGQYYCTNGLCTHELVRLGDGLILDFEIECPKHNGVFDYRSSKALRAPACDHLGTYETRLEGGRVYVLVP